MPAKCSPEGFDGPAKTLETGHANTIMNSPDDRAGTTWLRYTHLGTQYCLTLLLFVAAGWWADAHLECSPWLTIVGMLIGFVTSTYLIVKETSGMGRPR